MEVIEKYLESLYKNDRSKEVLELKEELREHLILSAKEFMNQGYNDRDSYKMAIDKFDDGADMLKELYSSLKYTKDTNVKLQKKVTNLFRNMIIISALIASIAIYISEKQYDKYQNIWDSVQVKLESIFETKDISKPETYKNEIEKVLTSDNFKDVGHISIMKSVETTDDDHWDNKVAINNKVRYYKISNEIYTKTFKTFKNLICHGIDLQKDKEYIGRVEVGIDNRLENNSLVVAVTFIYITVALLIMYIGRLIIVFIKNKPMKI